MFPMIIAKIGEVTEDFWHALDVFWKGMLAIFVAIGIIWCTIVVLNYFTKLKNKKQ